MQEKIRFGFLCWPHMWVTDNIFQQAEHISSLVMLPHPHDWYEEEKGPGKQAERDALSRAKADRQHRACEGSAWPPRCKGNAGASQQMLLFVVIVWQ